MSISFHFFPSKIALIALMAATPAFAHATDSTDIMVGLKTLPVLATKISGAATLAVVYDPALPDSKSDADAIKAAVDGLTEAPGGVKLQAILVGTNALSQLAGAKIAFLAKGVPPAAFDPVSNAANSGSILTISTDLACVKANKCILGVVSKPSVEIYFSKAASESAKVGFVPAFSMLAKQI